jgi:SmpA/OmlA family protein
MGTRRPRRQRGLPAWAWLTLAGGVALVLLVVGVVAWGSLRGLARHAVSAGNTVTKAHFLRLKSGMTEAQVRAIMGEPTAVDNYDDEKGKSRQLVWKNGEEYITIAFVDGISTFPTARLGGDMLFGRQ